MHPHLHHLARASTLAALTLCGSAFATPIVLVSDTFDSSFTGYTTPSGRSAFTHSATAGVGGDAGRLNHTLGTSTFAANYATSLGDFDILPWYEVSIFGLTTGTFSGTGEINVFGAGLGTSDTTLLGSGYTGFESIVRGTANPNSYVLRLRNNDSATGQELSTTFSLTANTWFQLTMRVTLTDDATDTFLVESSLYNRGADGTALASLVGSVTESYANTGLNDASSLYAGFLSRGAATEGTVAVDNFSVTTIPEPSTFALLAITLGAFALSLRRRAAR